jgi:tol-pal system protein YbgF
MLEDVTRVVVRHVTLGAPVLLSALAVGCEGDLPLRMMQRDLDSVRSEVAVVSKMTEGERTFLDDRLKKLETDVKSRLEKASQERAGDIDGFMRSQAELSLRLDELTDEVRSSHGRAEGVGHRIAEVERRLDGLGEQIGQFGRRLEGIDKQLALAVAAAQEAKTAVQSASTAAQNAGALAQQAVAASHQTAQHVTDALQQMADQTNLAMQQLNATSQLALTEARKAAAAQQTSQPAQAAAQTAPVVVRVPPPPASPPVPPSPTPTPPTSPDRPAVGAAASPGDLYKNALSDYAKGNYDLAIDGFRNYIALYPKTSLIPNAQYWLGESYYSQRKYDDAIKEFEHFVTQHPDNSKVASALLKQGYAYLELGNASRGRAVLSALVKRFPRSPEARLAKERLSKFKSDLDGRLHHRGAPPHPFVKLLCDLDVVNVDCATYRTA